MEKHVYDGQKCEILLTRYREQAAHLRDLNQYDLRVFGGFLAIQLALASWFAIHVPNGWPAKIAILIIDLALCVICQKFLNSNKLRRAEIRTTILNINEAFGLYTPGVYLPGKAINPPPIDNPFAWFYIGCWIAFFCFAAALIFGLSDASFGPG
jgi:hypothetical protein